MRMELLIFTNASRISPQYSNQIDPYRDVGRHGSGQEAARYPAASRPVRMSTGDRRKLKA